MSQKLHFTRIKINPNFKFSSPESHVTFYFDALKVHSESYKLLKKYMQVNLSICGAPDVPGKAQITQKRMV